MRVPRHPTNIRRMLDSRVKQMAARKPLLAASLVSFERRCGKPGCHCASGEKHRGHQLTYKVAARPARFMFPSISRRRFVHGSTNIAGSNA